MRFTVVRADLMNPGSKGFQVVDAAGVPVALGHHDTYGAAALMARELTEMDRQPRAQQRARSGLNTRVRRAGGGRDAIADPLDQGDNLGESPDY